MEWDFCGLSRLHLLDIDLNLLVGYGKYYISFSAKHIRAHLKCFDFVFFFKLCRNV